MQEKARRIEQITKELRVSGPYLSEGERRKLEKIRQQLKRELERELANA